MNAVSFVLFIGPFSLYSLVRDAAYFDCLSGGVDEIVRRDFCPHWRQHHPLFLAPVAVCSRHLSAMRCGMCATNWMVCQQQSKGGVGSAHTVECFSVLLGCRFLYLKPIGGTVCRRSKYYEGMAGVARIHSLFQDSLLIFLCACRDVRWETSVGVELVFSRYSGSAPEVVRTSIIFRLTVFMPRAALTACGCTKKPKSSFFSC